MADQAASLLAKINSNAKQLGWDNMQCLQLFCQEEFIRRMRQSKYKDAFILKGGLFVFVLSNFASRTTRDADFLVEGLSNTSEAMSEVVSEIIKEKQKMISLNSTLFL